MAVLSQSKGAARLRNMTQGIATVATKALAASLLHFAQIALMFTGGTRDAGTIGDFT